jgi:hypothetical protein
VAALGGAVMAAGGTMVAASGNVAQYGDQIDKMSQKMGLSAEAYQEWDAVMQHSGTSMEAMKASMKTLANAAETNSAAFGELGISQEQLASMSQEELQRMVSMNPDYFFDMLPYAIALGVDTRFAKAFGKMRLPDCSYLLIRQNEKRSASEWALLVRKIADRMDERQRRMELETWIPVAPPPKRR